MLQMIEAAGTLYVHAYTYILMYVSLYISRNNIWDISTKEWQKTEDILHYHYIAKL